MADAPDRFPPGSFTPAAMEVLRLAEQDARELETAEVKNPHLLLALVNEGSSVAARALRVLEISYPDTRRMLRYPPPKGPFPEPLEEGVTPSLSSEVFEVLRRAVAECESEGLLFADPGHILISLSETEGEVATLLEERSGGPSQVRDLVRALRGSRGDESQESEPVQADPAEPLETVPTLRDGPATVDDLGRGRFAEVLGERMRRVRGEDTERPARNWLQRWRKRRRDAAEAQLTGPFMVNIHAPWGAGKSSLLNFLAADLRNREPLDGGAIRRTARFFFGRRRAMKPQLSRWIVVNFNAWEHQRLATPWWWLLAAMQRRCGRELWWIDRRGWAWFWARDVAWRIWNVRIAALTVAVLAALVGVAWAFEWFGLADESLTTLQTVLLTAGSAAAVATTLFTVVRGASRWLAIGSAEGADRFLKRASDPLGVYRRRFRWLVRSTGQPIAVFVDDLDRCRPEYVVELLEGIQTLFLAEPVAYVVAADRTWLHRSFGKAYEDFEGTVEDPSRPLGFRFLEKTFQISMEIPPMNDDVRETFWGGLLGASVDGDGRDIDRPSPAADAFAKLSTQEEVEDHARRLVEKGMEPDDVYAGAVRRFNASAIQQQTETLLSKFAPLLERNPRSMKRLVNAYGFERDLLIRQGHFLDEEERRQLALLTILRLRWPLFAEHLRDNPADADLCVGGNGSTPEDGHKFKHVFGDPSMRVLFGDSVVGTKLDRGLIEEFPKRERAGASPK